MQSSVDVLICSVPSLSLDRVPAAPALLKGAAEEVGYSAYTLDLSLNFFTQQCNSDLAKYEYLSCAFRPSAFTVDESRQFVDDWLENSIKEIKAINPKIIGVSVFTFWQHRATRLLLFKIKETLPNLKIIVGGYGLTGLSNSLSTEQNVSKIDQLLTFHQYLQKHKLADYIVLDDPLNEFINILNKELGQPCNNDINNWTITDSTQNFNTPIPNYDDYKFDQYLWNDGYNLPVTGSLGCVRNCTFCNVRGVFGKFKFRTGVDVATEIIKNHQKYGITSFDFTDSLVNGSLKAFREWVTLLAEYNDSLDTDNKISWTGQYICRPAAQMPEDLYALMARSGVKNLVIGVESGSNEILEAIKKKMTVEDALNEFRQFEKYKIKTHVLIISGFYNETWERFLETLKFIINCQPYIAKGVITSISVSIPLFITNDSPLYNEAENLGLILDHHNMFNWKSKSLENYDFVERARRRLITQALLDRLNIPISAQSISHLNQLLELLKERERSLTEKLQCLVI